MLIRSARITDFRNLSETDIEFSPGVNLILGENGHGKTNLLESLNYIAFGRSHRRSRNEDLICFDAESLHVLVSISGAADDEEAHAREFEYALQRGGGRRLKIDGNSVRRRADIVGLFFSVFFDPTSLEIIRGGPSGRRRFVDQGQSSTDTNYLVSLLAWRRALKQKARLLIDAKRSGGAAGELVSDLQVWNREIAHHAVSVHKGRQKYTDNITPYLSANYKDISSSSKEIGMTYVPSLEIDMNSKTDAEIEEEIFAEFDYIMSDEIRRGRPLRGPQSDDFRIELEDRELRIFGSQGETRSAAISLILAQSEVVFRRRGIRPVLFFDDIFSELDRERSRHLQERAARDHQVFIATARPEDIADWRPAGMKSWEVRSGSLYQLP